MTEREQLWFLGGIFAGLALAIWGSVAAPLAGRILDLL